MPEAGTRGMGSECFSTGLPLGVMGMFWNEIEVMAAQHHEWTISH